MDKSVNQKKVSYFYKIPRHHQDCQIVNRLQNAFLKPFTMCAPFNKHTTKNKSANNQTQIKAL